MTRCRVPIVSEVALRHRLCCLSLGCLGIPDHRPQFSTSQTTYLQPPEKEAPTLHKNALPARFTTAPRALSILSPSIILDPRFFHPWRNKQLASPQISPCGIKRFFKSECCIWARGHPEWREAESGVCELHAQFWILEVRGEAIGMYLKKMIFYV